MFPLIQSAPRIQVGLNNLAREINEFVVKFHLCKKLQVFPNSYCICTLDSLVIFIFAKYDIVVYVWSGYLVPGVQKVGTAGTAGAGQTTFGWTK